MLTSRTWSQIDLGAVEHNYKEIMRVTGKPAIAVVKADAYGHGAVELAQVYEKMGAPLMAVACASEAKDLRDHGIKTPILLLGITPIEELKEMNGLNLVQAVSSATYAQELARSCPDIAVHIKVETGMGRLGVRTVDEICQIAEIQNVEGIFTHFADADNPNLKYTEQQMDTFLGIIEEAQKRGISFKYCHCANSAAVIHYEKAYNFDLVRPGLALYGLYTDERHEKLDLRPVMTLYTRIFDIRTICEGESISYGRTFTAGREMRVAVLPIGYADGLRRGLSNSGEVFLNDTRVPIIGRICMDMCMVDISYVPNANINDIVEVFGTHISVDELAQKVDTISYEICTGISKRVPRVYL